MSEQESVSQDKNLSVHDANVSGFKILRHLADKKAKALLEAAPAEIENLRKELDSLARAAGAVNRWATAEMDKRNPFTDSTYQSMVDLRENSAIVNSSALSLKHFSQEIVTGKNGAQQLSPSQIAWRELALDEVRERLSQGLRKISDTPVKSETIDRFKKMIAGLSLLAAGGSGLGFVERGVSTEKAATAQVQETQTGFHDIRVTKSGKGLLSGSHHGERRRTEMSGEGEAGKLEKGAKIASVEYAWNSSIDDPLWATSVSAPDKDGLVGVRESQGKAESTVEARVKLERNDYARYETVNLPRPVGFAVANVKVEPKEGSYVLNSEGTVNFEKDVPGAVISYEVVRLEKVEYEKSKNSAEASGSETRRELVSKISASDIEGSERIIDRELSEFTYMVSTDMQEIVDAMGVSEDQAAEGTRLGDCDVMSVYAARLLAEGGKSAYVANGILENEHELSSGMAHAKFFILKDGKPRMHESTDKTKKSYINLVLKPQDKDRLKAIASRINRSSSLEERNSLFVEFRKAVDEILKDPHYKQFEGRNNFHGTQGAGMEMLLKNLRSSNFEFLDTNLGSAGLMVLIVLAMGGAIMATDAAFKRLLRRAKQRQMEETAKHLQESLGQTREKPDEPEELDEDLERSYGRFLEDSPGMAEFISPENFKKLNLEEKRSIILLFKAAYYFSCGEYCSNFHGPLDYLLTRIATGKWRRLLKQAQADGLRVEDLLKRIGEAFNDPKRVEKKLKSITADKKAVLDKATAMTAKILDKDFTSSERRFKAFAQSVGLEALQGVANAKRRKAGMGSEYFDTKGYVPGDDVRQVDWPAYARTGELHVRRKQAEDRDSVPKLDFELVIETSDMDQEDYEDFAALLLYSAKHPEDVRVNSIHFSAFGTVIERLDRKTMQAFLAKGPSAIRSMVEYIIGKAMEIGIRHGLNADTMRSLYKRTGESEGYYLPSPVGFKPNQAVLLVSGRRLTLDPYGKKMSYANRIFGFRRPEDEDVKEAA